MYGGAAERAFQEILQRFSARQLRLAFLSQLWNAKVDFSEALMTGEVRSIETIFNVRPSICRACGTVIADGARRTSSRPSRPS